MTRHFDPRVWAYFNWQFFTGMRPEETIALRRTDIDLSARTALVQVVRTDGLTKEHTKNHKSRPVHINDRALASIHLMQQYWKDGDHGLVFERPEWKPEVIRPDCHPDRPHMARGMCRNCYAKWRRNADKSGERFEARKHTGGRGQPQMKAGPWNDARAQNRTYWKPTLDALGIRYRNPYKTRHTYATIGLENGVDPTWLAGQLGHNVMVFLTIYAHWINQSAHEQQVKKLNAAVGSISPKFLPAALRVSLAA
jgi:integrase